MYAVIKTGGKQYKVSAGDRIQVAQIPAEIGSELKLEQVLAVGAGDSLEFGAPLVGGASVSATVIAHGRGKKVRIFKMRRRKHYQKRQGHRQNYTELFIGGIASAAGNETADAAPALESARKRQVVRDRAAGRLAPAASTSPAPAAAGGETTTSSEA